VDQAAAGFLVDVRKEKPNVWIDPSVQRPGFPQGAASRWEAEKNHFTSDGKSSHFEVGLHLYGSGD